MAEAFYSIFEYSERGYSIRAGPQESAHMPSSTIYAKENEVLSRLIREMRTAAGLTQAACAEALGKPQSYVSKIEGGTQRIDLLQLRDYCQICGISLTVFVRRFENNI